MPLLLVCSTHDRQLRRLRLACLQAVKQVLQLSFVIACSQSDH